MRKTNVKYLIGFCLILFSFSAYCQDTIVYWEPDKYMGNVEYKAHYIKLKRLFVQHLESESYVNYKKLQDAFAAKINVNSSPEGNKLILEAQNMDEIMKWVAENIEETNFKDYAEVEAESRVLDEAFIPVLKENREYFNYLKEIFKLDYGKELLANVFEEVMMETPEKF